MVPAALVAVPDRATGLDQDKVAGRALDLAAPVVVPGRATGLDLDMVAGRVLDPTALVVVPDRATEQGLDKVAVRAMVPAPKLMQIWKDPSALCLPRPARGIS